MVVVLLIVFFPVGLYALWKNSRYTTKTKGIVTGVLALLLIIGMTMQAVASKNLQDADALWASGDQSGAVAKYKTLLTDNYDMLDVGDRPRLFQRVIEFELSRGDKSTARSLLDKALQSNVSLAFSLPEATTMLAQAQGRSESQIKQPLRAPDKASVNSTAKPAPQTISETPKETLKTYKMKETVSVGYTSYCVWKVEWRESLGIPGFEQKANAAFLVLDITVRNDDKKARTVPPLKLIDESGAEYEAATAGMMQGEGWFNVLEDLNPTVSKRGNLAFDVPKGRNYRLKLSGGFWSTEDAYVQLALPKAGDKPAADEQAAFWKALEDLLDKSGRGKLRFSEVRRVLGDSTEEINGGNSTRHIWRLPQFQATIQVDEYYDGTAGIFGVNDKTPDSMREQLRSKK